jgi:cardiolipin synthase C
MSKAVLNRRYFYPLILHLVTIIGCADQNKYQPIDEDFCASIHISDTARLSHYLAPLHDHMQESTGVYALEEGDVSMIARAWLTEAAEKSIDIQYFIFSADNIGLIAIDYLLRAADRGVKVRVIVDDIMVEADADELLAIDAHPNISIKIYNPSANIGKNLPEKLYSLASDFKEFNQRMHNKTFIVDEQVVITGGRNIADEYFDYDHEYNFRDRDVLLLGKGAGEVQRSFDEFWNNPLSVPVNNLVEVTKEKLNLDVKYNWLHQYACNPENFWPQVRQRIKDMPIAFQQIQKSGNLVWTNEVSFVSDVPGKNKADGLDGGGVATDSLMQLIKNAKISVLIQSPYLVTTEASQLLFKEAIDRGVRIKILTNSLASTDNLEAFSGYLRDREKLLEIGVKIYEFKPDAAIRYEVMTGALQKEIGYQPIFGLHAKSMTIDDKIAVIGTYNLDPRSVNLNTECVTIIRDSKIAQDLSMSIDADMRPENAWETTPNVNPDKEAGNWKRFRTWLRGVVPKSVL